MTREDKFMSYFQEDHSVVFNAHDLHLIPENPEKAETDGQLISFLCFYSIMKLVAWFSMPPSKTPSLTP